MRVAKIICCFVIAVMAINFAIAIHATGIHTGLGTDVFFSGAAANPWQAGIDADLMMGLLLMVSWVLWRERSRINAIVWILVILYWGNIVVAFYILRQLNNSGDRWDVVMLGKHATNAPPEAMDASSREAWPLPIKLLLYAFAIALGVYVVQASVAVNFAFAPTVGYVGGLGCFIYVLLRIAAVGKLVGKPVGKLVGKHNIS
jgi:hypothetical protein